MHMRPRAHTGIAAQGDLLPLFHMLSRSYQDLAEMPVPGLPADSAVKCGLPRDKAYTMVAQTVLGSAKMVLETGKHPGELKDMVCSPGGTTIAAVEALEEYGLRNALMKATDACYGRCQSV